MARHATTAPTHTLEQMMRLQDAARLLAVSTDTIRRRIADGSLPAFHVGRQLRVREADVAALARRLTTVGAL